MTVFKVIYTATILILWLLIVLNFLCILRSNKLQKEYHKAINLAHVAEQKFLDVAKTYRKMTEELCAEQEAQEDNHDEV